MEINMRINQVKIIVAGMIVLVLMTGCGLNSNTVNNDTVNNNNANQDSANQNNADNNNANEGSNNIVSGDIEDFDHKAGVQESQTYTGTGQAGENGQPQSQPQAAGDIEEELAAYRAEREKGVSTHGNYTMVQAPNEENYHYGVGEHSYISRFDSRELNEAYNAADAYIKDTLNLKSEAWSCIDPRMIAIYEDEDKGVASGYDADNIFLCEYNDNGNWQYLILVREGKGSDWEVLYHGSSYKTD